MSERGIVACASQIKRQSCKSDTSIIKLATEKRRRLSKVLLANHRKVELV